MDRAIGLVVVPVGEFRGDHGHGHIVGHDVPRHHSDWNLHGDGVFVGVDVGVVGVVPSFQHDGGGGRDKVDDAGMVLGFAAGVGRKVDAGCCFRVVHRRIVDASFVEATGHGKGRRKYHKGKIFFAYAVRRGSFLVE